MAEKDIEARKPTPIPFFRQVFDQAGITPEVENWQWPGSGTEDDPYVVGWIDDDPRNPMRYSSFTKWSITMVVAIATLAVAFVSSGYSGGAIEIIGQFRISAEVYTLGISLFVVGFAVGPLLWAPLSELFGRQILYVVTYAMLTAFNAGAAGAQNIQTLVILRFFAGTFGASPLTNAGGVIADMFTAKERGLALSFFAAAPFMGPVLGPIVGGFVGETVGWRWVEGVMAIFTGVLWIVGSFCVPETYAPVIHRKRAAKLSEKTGKVYRSRGDIDQGPTTAGQVFASSLSRPWILLFREPIVLLLSVWLAIIYGTLYMLFAAYPIVYQETRGWSPGIGGLPFLGVAVGMIGAVAYSIWDNKRYVKINDAYKGFAPPEARLPPAMLGGVLIPIGLFWFAWTNYPSIHFMVSISAGVPFGFGMVLTFLAIFNYLIDSYTIFAASVLAANSILRSLFGAAFPLFTSYMYSALGIHWASTIPAFLALACAPISYLFWKYGAKIREKCKYAAISRAFLEKLQEQAQQPDPETETEDDVDAQSSDETSEKVIDQTKEHEEEREEDVRQEAIDYSWEEEEHGTRLAPIKTGASAKSARSGRSHERVTDYSGNPFDLDRVNTRESFRPPRSRANSTASRRTGR